MHLRKHCKRGGKAEYCFLNDLIKISLSPSSGIVSRSATHQWLFWRWISDIDQYHLDLGNTRVKERELGEEEKVREERILTIEVGSVASHSEEGFYAQPAAKAISRQSSRPCKQSTAYPRQDMNLRHPIIIVLMTGANRCDCYPEWTITIQYFDAQKCHNNHATSFANETLIIIMFHK